MTTNDAEIRRLQRDIDALGEAHFRLRAALSCLRPLAILAAAIPGNDPDECVYQLSLANDSVAVTAGEMRSARNLFLGKDRRGSI